MAVKIRLARHGAKKYPYYRVVVIDGRARRDGRAICEVGRYNPNTNPKLVKLDLETIDEWIAKGAQPTDAVARLIEIARAGGPTLKSTEGKLSKKAAKKAAEAAAADAE
ncbi:MAG: 30S ribosomal protein S16 [bacterium]|nr:30S ribosomal protein S16 [bacterium]